MKKAISLVAALALAGTTLVACGKSPITANAPTNNTPVATTPVDVEVVNLAAKAEQNQFAEVPEYCYDVKLEEEVKIQEFTVRIYSYKNDGLDGFFLIDQAGHSFNLYGESEYYVNENFNIGFGATERLGDAYLWVYPEETGFMTVCHPNK